MEAQSDSAAPAEATPGSSSTEIRSVSSTESDSPTAVAVGQPEATPGNSSTELRSVASAESEGPPEAAAGSSSIPHPDSVQVWTPEMKRLKRLLSSLKDGLAAVETQEGESMAEGSQPQPVRLTPQPASPSRAGDVEMEAPAATSVAVPRILHHARVPRNRLG